MLLLDLAAGEIFFEEADCSSEMSSTKLLIYIAYF